MQSHVVLYKAYPGNPQAADSIINQAEILLRPIPSVYKFHAGFTINTGRVVGNNSYDVMLNIHFLFELDYEHYMSHPLHMEFVRFVLRGYMLKDSQAEDPEAEFIEHILCGGAPRERVRNPAILDSEVVWGDEIVFDAKSSGPKA
jgi:hypothetical protein